MAATRLPLRRLLIFEAAVRLGSIGAASRDIGLSQPAATHSLAALERDAGAALLERDARGSVATDSGRLLHRRCARMLAQMEAGLADAIAGVAHPPRPLRHLTDAQLRAHLAIDEAGSFRAASALLGVAEPTLQRAARALERSVGAPLYARRAHGIAASAAGQRLAAAWRLALAEIEQALDELRAAQGLAGGRLALGCLPLMPKTLLARAVGRLLRAHPNAAISLEENSYELLMPRLLAGGIDMMLGALRREDATGPTRQRLLFPDPWVVVARRAHPLAGIADVDAEALARHPWVVPWHDTPRRLVLEALFDRLPRRPLAVLETSSVAMIGATLAESDCLSLMSHAQIGEDAAAGALAVLDCGLASFDRRVGVVTRADWLPTAMQERFVAILGEGLEGGMLAAPDAGVAEFAGVACNRDEA